MLDEPLLFSVENLHKNLILQQSMGVLFPSVQTSVGLGFHGVYCFP